MNEKQIRDVATNLRKQASALENSLPAPDMNRVDYKPAYELGTRHIEYINGIRCVHKYVEVREYRNINYQWV